MRDALDRVFQTVRPVVHRVDAPFVAGAVMDRAEYAVHERVAHVHVRMRHVDFRTQHLFTVREPARFHPLEEAEVFFNASAAVRAVFAGRGKGSTAPADFLCALVVHVRLPGLDELDGVLVHPVEIIGSVKDFAVPFEPEPFYVFDYRLDVFLVLHAWVRVVESEVAAAAVFLGDGEAQADRLCVSDVQVSVRLRREARMHASVVLSGPVVFVDNIANKIACVRGVRGVHFVAPVLKYLVTISMQNQ
jgi:hypothetical protein